MRVSLSVSSFFHIQLDKFWRRQLSHIVPASRGDSMLKRASYNGRTIYFILIDFLVISYRTNN